MASEEVSGFSALGSLIALALAKMVQMSGQVCRTDARLHLYLCIVPLVAASDALSASIWFVAYMFSCKSHSPFHAALQVMVARDAEEAQDDPTISAHSTNQNEAIDSMELENGRVSPSRDEDQEHVALPSPRNSQPIAVQKIKDGRWVRFLLFILGTLPQIVKVEAWDGLTFTKLWSWCYVGSFVVMEILQALASAGSLDAEFHKLGYLNTILSYFEVALGIASGFAHFGFLAVVDLDPKPLNKILWKLWLWRFFRLVCGVLPLAGIYLIMTSNAARVQQAGFFGRPRRTLTLIFVVLVLFQFLNWRFTVLYLALQIVISAFIMEMYSIGWIRREIMFCHASGTDVWHVLAFDVCVKTAMHAIFWYGWRYDKFGTSTSPVDDVVG